MFDSLATQESTADPVADPAGFAVVDVAGFAELDPVGFLAAATQALAKLPSQLWRTGNDGFAGIAEGDGRVGGAAGLFSGWFGR